MMGSDRLSGVRITSVRRRALGAIRDGHGRCGLSLDSGYLVPPARPYRGVGVLHRAGLAERGTKLNEYAYQLVLTDAGRAVLDEDD